MHKALFFVLALAFPFSAMAYSFDDVGHYTDEQFRLDVKSYLDYQRQQQETQQYQQTINNILNQSAPSAGNAGGAPTDYDIAQLQKQIDQSAELSKQQQAQIDQLNTILQKQSDTLAAQAAADTAACKAVQDGQSAGKMYYLDADAVSRCKSLGVPVLSQQENLEVVIAGIRADASKNTATTDTASKDDGAVETPAQNRPQANADAGTDNRPHTSFAEFYENSGGTSSSDVPVVQDRGDQRSDFFGSSIVVSIFHSIRSWFSTLGF